MGVLSNLSQFGLGNLEKMDVFEDEAKSQGENGKKTAAKAQPTEADFLFEKNFDCPVCGERFQTKIVRSNGVKLISQDMDLRPKYQNVDSLKYDAIACPNCGYAALSRFFKQVLPSQEKLIKANISATFRGLKPTGDIYTYDDAIARHQLALANTVVKKAKLSERAYTCLKLAWLCRGKAETLPKDTSDYNEQIKELQEDELEMISNAYNGFMSAFSKEDFPMCGMDETTITYLIAVFAYRTKKYEEASRWVSRVITSREANERIKERARDLKELINKERPDK